jgi:hypothetical protein
VRWKRVVIGAVLGGLLGFGGQFVADFFGWGFIDNGYGLQSLWTLSKSSGFDLFWTEHGERGRELWAQSILLAWLDQRGDLAYRTALFVAFFSASAALALDRKREPVHRQIGR